jgi:hypothetical protein
MRSWFIASMASLAVVAATMVASPAMGDTQKPMAAKLKTSNQVTFKQKLGYWVECRYTGLGEECYYVFAKPKGSNKLERVKAKNTSLKKKGNYWIECHYTGLGQECNYVYATVKPKS